MSVYSDYMNQQWSQYFTENFRIKHLRPFHYVPIGGHKEAQERAKQGNVALNQRFQKGNRVPKGDSNSWDTDWSSLIFDMDPEAEAPRQILQLMQEVESRNVSKYYEQKKGEKAKVFQTLQSYYIQTTGHGSKQSLVQKPFLYNVLKDKETGRWVICHFDGT